jgi:hypothetical protein
MLNAVVVDVCCGKIFVWFYGFTFSNNSYAREKSDSGSRFWVT